MTAAANPFATAGSPPVFSGDNYPIWAVRMRTYLKSLDLWEFIESDVEPTLPNNPTVAQMRQHSEQVAKKHRALAVLHSAISEVIFTRVLTCDSAKEAWDTLKAEFQGSERTRKMQIMNLWREFEMLKMKESQSVKEYTHNLMNVVNQLRLLEVKIDEQRIVEKVLVSVSERFEAKIAALEEKDLTAITLAEVVNSLHASDQRRFLRQEDPSEVAFQAVSKGIKAGSSSGSGKRTNSKKNDKEKKDSDKNEGKKHNKFPPCKFCQKRNHLERFCWHKPYIRCRACNQLGHVERICKNKAPLQQQTQQAHVAEAEDQEEKLFMVTASGSNFNSNSWLIDSACTSHMTPDEGVFIDLDRGYTTSIQIGNGDWIRATGK